MNEKYYELRYNFIGGYFHQDWTLNADTYVEVVEDFIADHDLEFIDVVVGQLREYIAEIELNSPSDEEIQEFLKCEYYFQADGLTGRRWLEDVLKILTSSRKRPSGIKG
ncbi:MAG: contact-dependent growth inhibition system immunity protein [Devosia sp.]